MLSLKKLVFIFFSFYTLVIVSSSIRNYAHSLVKPSFRLPDNIIPKYYKIQLEPDIDNATFTFNGTSVIKFDVVEPTKDIIFHSSDYITIDENYTELIGNNTIKFKPIIQRWNYFYEFFVVRFNFTLDIGSYSIALKWFGRDGEHDGIFRRSIPETNGNETSIVVATHFQASSARRVFPCWDEPGYRTPFEISIKHPSNYTALSNMPIKNQFESDDKKLWTNFETTPAMSTYLVTFILSNYHHYSGDNNITFWAPKNYMHEVYYAFNVSQYILPALEKYTGIKYPLPKLDQITIPFFPAGGTEHYGMISYGEISYEIKECDRVSQDRVTLLVAHEMAHQWFGNLVTPKWWNDLWLSEAFAVYFSYKISDQALVEQHYVETFAVSAMNKISFNAEKLTRIPHPVTFMPKRSSEIRDLFTPITYRKGAAIVRMLEHIITEEIFQQGLSKYLQKHQMGTVETDDLWQALQETYNEKNNNNDKHLDIKKIMNPWINQTGYPIVNITRDYQTNLINITQNDYLNLNSKNTWTIPISIATSLTKNFNSTEPTIWLNKSSCSFNIDGINNTDWIILNVQQTGFYRVNYDFENWKRIAEYLNSDDYHNIHVINRAQLLWDLLSFSLKDERYIDILIDVLFYLHRETNYLPWIPAIDVIEQLSTLLINTPIYNVFEKFSLYIMDDIVNYIGFDNDPNDGHLIALAKYYILPWAADLGHVKCRNAAREKLIEKLQNSKIISYHSQQDSWIYCNGLKKMNETVWENFIGGYFENPALEPHLIYIGCLNNHDFIKKYIDLIIQHKNASEYTLTEALSSVMSGVQQNVDFIIDYFIENIEKIRQFYKEREMPESTKHITRKISGRIKNNDQLEKLSKFLAQQEAEGKMSRTSEMITTARTVIALSEKIALKFRNKMNEKAIFSNFINNM